MKLKNMNSKMKMRGFTLLELIVVIAIIGVLSVVVLPNFATALARGRDGRRVSELKGLATNLFLYYQQFGAYPTSYGTVPVAADTANVTYGWSAIVNARLEDRLPTGARTTNAGAATKDVALTPYRYVGILCGDTVGTQRCQGYMIWSQLEATNVALADDSDVYGRAGDGTGTATTNNISEIFPAADTTNPCQQTPGPANGLFTDCAKLPQRANAIVGGVAVPLNNEQCISRSANNNTVAAADCVFDLVP